MIDWYFTFEILGQNSAYFGESDNCDFQVLDAESGKPVALEAENIGEHKNSDEGGSGLDWYNISHEGVVDENRESLLDALTFYPDLHRSNRHTVDRPPSRYGFDSEVVITCWTETGN